MSIIDDSRSGMTPEKQQKIKNSSQTTKNAQSGIGATVKQEVYPQRINTPAEKVWSGYNNSHIVLGKDRDDEPTTGFGGRGYGRSGMIHLVAGHFGARLDEVEEDPKNPVLSNPNFNLDSAYIYISQRANIDTYLRLKDGIVGNVEESSAIALKADSIRIIGDRGIKLVTRRSGEDSTNKKIFKVKGIDLIAGNDDSDMQPIPKGINTILAFDKLSKIVDDLIDTIMEVNYNTSLACTALANHQHTTNVPGSPTLPFTVDHINVNLKNATIFTEITNNKLDILRKDITKFKEDHLDSNGDVYIASKFNTTN